MKNKIGDILHRYMTKYLENFEWKEEANADKRRVAVMENGRKRENRENVLVIINLVVQTRGKAVV